MSYKRLTDNTKTELLLDCHDCPYCGVEYLYDCHIKVANRLVELEDKIENGTLIELPCKVGDTVYLVHNEKQRHPFKFVVEDVRYMKGSWYVDSSTYGGKVGKYVFFTKSEAEKKLKEIQNER